MVDKFFRGTTRQGGKMMRKDVRRTIKKVNKLAKGLEKFGFRLFESPDFNQLFITKILCAQETQHADHADWVLPNEIRIEILTSRTMYSGRPSGGAGDVSKVTFTWRNILGADQTKKEAGEVDYLVLCGFYKGWHFWVIPYAEVNNQSAEFTLETDTPHIWGKESWISDYFVGDLGKLIKYFDDLDADILITSKDEDTSPQLSFFDNP